ncbi:hypothetical protein B7463_g1631, partial [Scytalidium lignicola]
MPRGRPKTVIAPCQHCNKQFKRAEHLKRHERTHTNEKPFLCNCGQRFTRQLSHPSGPCISPPPAELVRTSMIQDVDMGRSDIICDLDLNWDPIYMSQDILPATLFDTYFPFVDTQPTTLPPQTSNFSRFSSRLPPLDDIENDAEDDAEDEDLAEGTTSANAVPWSVTVAAYERLNFEVQNYSEALPGGCSLPSRSTLTRLLEKYLVCVHEYLPFIHPATFSVEQRDVELSLAMAALGSLYRFEHPKSYELYFMAKIMLLEKIRRENLQFMSNFLSGQSHSILDERNDLGKIQTFILLIEFASWADKKILPDALSMSSQLAMLVRQNGISDSDEMPQYVDWFSWVAVEERRRTLLAAYVLFNLHSIAFDIPPLILNHEVGVFLPGYSEQWKAMNITQWRHAPRQVERQFQQGLRSLFDGTGIPRDASVSSFSNYLLIHGLLQQIYIDRHGCAGSLQPDTIKSFERALRTWQLSWEITYESTLDPLSPKGPFGLSSAALLRLAYIRLNSNLDPYRGLLSRDLGSITNRSSNLSRSPHVDRAILHAAHALSIPVRVGIMVMSSTKTSIWSIEHSLCSLECALLLNDWLEMMSTSVRACGPEGLRKVERRLLGIITGIIKETCLAKTLDVLEDDSSRFHRMATMVLKLWTQIFKGSNVLEIDNIIGAGLQLLVDTNLD